MQDLVCFSPHEVHNVMSIMTLADIDHKIVRLSCHICFNSPLTDHVFTHVSLIYCGENWSFCYDFFLTFAIKRK